jgi:hypothetical protein
MAEPRAKGEAPRMKVEQLTDALRRLVAKRQALRECDASWAELEQNRLEIVRGQHALAHALIEIHLLEQLPQAA